MQPKVFWRSRITNWPLLPDSRRITWLAIFLCMRCAFVLTCFSVVCNYTKATQMHNSLMLVSFHFPASLPSTVILHKETDRESDIESRGEAVRQQRYKYNSSQVHQITYTATSAPFSYSSELRIRNCSSMSLISGWSDLWHNLKSRTYIGVMPSQEKLKKIFFFTFFYLTY